MYLILFYAFFTLSSAQQLVELADWQFNQLVASQNDLNVRDFSCDDFPDVARWKCDQPRKRVLVPALPPGTVIPTFVPGPDRTNDKLGYCTGSTTMGPYDLSTIGKIALELAQIEVHYNSHFIFSFDIPPNFDFYNGSPNLQAHYTGKPLKTQVSLKQIDNMLFALSQLSFEQTSFDDKEQTAIDVSALGMATGSVAYDQTTNVSSIFKWFQYEFKAPNDKIKRIISPDIYYTMFFKDDSVDGGISYITLPNPGLQLFADSIEETEVALNYQLRSGITVSHISIFSNIPQASYNSPLTPLFSFFHSDKYVLSSWLRFQNYYTYEGRNITAEQLSDGITDTMRDLVYVQCHERPEMCKCEGNYSSQALAIGAFGFDSTYSKIPNTAIYENQTFQVHSPILHHIGSVPLEGPYTLFSSALPDLPDIKASNLPAWLPESVGEEIEGVLNAVDNFYKHIKDFWEILQHIEEIIEVIKDIASLKPSGGSMPDAVPV